MTYLQIRSNIKLTDKPEKGKIPITKHFQLQYGYHLHLQVRNRFM